MEYYFIMGHAALINKERKKKKNVENLPKMTRVTLPMILHYTRITVFIQTCRHNRLICILRFEKQSYQQRLNISSSYHSLTILFHCFTATQGFIL